MKRIRWKFAAFAALLALFALLAFSADNATTNANDAMVATITADLQYGQEATADQAIITKQETATKALDSGQSNLINTTAKTSANSPPAVTKAMVDRIIMPAFIRCQV